MRKENCLKSYELNFVTVSSVSILPSSLFSLQNLLKNHPGDLLAQGKRDFAGEARSQQPSLHVSAGSLCSPHLVANPPEGASWKSLCKY